MAEVWRRQLRPEERYRLVIVPAEVIRRRRFAAGARSLVDLGAPDLKVPGKIGDNFRIKTVRYHPDGFPPGNYLSHPCFRKSSSAFPGSRRVSGRKARNPSSVQSE